MPIDLKCPQCGQKYRVQDDAAGKTIRCRKCSAAVPVPAPTATIEDDFSSLDLDDTAYGSVEGAFPPPQPGRKKPKGGASRSKKKQRSSSGGGGALKWVLICVGGGVTIIALCCGGAYWFVNRTLENIGESLENITASAEVPAGMTFQQWRDGFQTNLIKHGPPPDANYQIETPFAGVEEVLYPSDGMQLKAWVYRPQGAPGPHPALVFFHGGFAFGSGDLDTCRPFMDAGFVVMAPMLRAENGNPGEFELFLGEVDDARAAVKWLAGQPDVDTARIYTFGHSVGGGVSAMLSLLADVPIRHGGSSGGLYDHATFVFDWSDMVPFENTPEERTVRVLVGNTQHMQHKHFAYIGTDDDGFDMVVEELNGTMGPDALLAIERVPGDHFTSFDESLQRYLRVVQSNP